MKLLIMKIKWISSIDSADINRHETGNKTKLKKQKVQTEQKELPSLKIIAKWYPVSFWNSGL